MFKIKRLFLSLKYSLKGIKKTWKEEQNLQIQSIVAVLVLIFAYLYALKPLEWAIVILLIALVMLMELINSAIERVSDALKPRISSYVKEIKDISAAAVMFSSIVAIIIGLIIFWPYLFV